LAELVARLATVTASWNNDGRQLDVNQSNLAGDTDRHPTDGRTDGKLYADSRAMGERRRAMKPRFNQCDEHGKITIMLEEFVITKFDQFLIYIYIYIYEVYSPRKAGNIATISEVKQEHSKLNYILPGAGSTNCYWCPPAPLKLLTHCVST